MKAEASLPLILKELRLPSISRIWKEISNEATNEGWSYSTYLKVLFEHELVGRENRRLLKRVKESMIPGSKVLENFDFNAVEGANKLKILGLGKGDIWMKEKMNLLIFGPSGVGKSHLAAGIGKQLIENGYRVLYTRTSKLLQKLQAAKRDLNLPGYLAKLDKYDCLILDDFGYVKKNEMETNLLFELICERYEKKSLMITSNQPFAEWDQIFECNRMAVAAVDRLVHHAVILELKGESYRKQQALKRN